MIKFWFCVWWRYRCRHWWIWRKYSRIYTNTMTVGKCLLLLSMSCTYADLSPEFAFCYLTDKIIQKFCLLQGRDTDWRESMYSTQLDVRTHSNNLFRLLCIRASMLLDIPNIPVPARIQCEWLLLIPTFAPSSSSSAQFFFAIVCVLTSQWRHSHQVTGLVFSCYFVSIMIRIVHFSSWVFCSHNEFSYVLCCTLSHIHTFDLLMVSLIRCTHHVFPFCFQVLVWKMISFLSSVKEEIIVFFSTFQNEVEKLIPYLNLTKLLIFVME